MKKIISCLTALLFLFGFAGCASEEEVKKTKEESLSDLTAAELYDYAVEKTLSGLKVKWETTLDLPDGEEKTVETLRFKEGYDGFNYSRTGFEEDLWFLSSTAYVRSAQGSYSSATSSRAFQEYLEETVLPTGLVSHLLASAEKTEDGVSYVLKEDKLSLFHLTLSGGDFIAESAEGKAEIDEKGLVLQEEILVKGTFNGEEKELRVQTKANFAPEEEITLPEDEVFAQVGDIRVPFRITEGVKALAKKSNQEIVLLVSGSLSGEKALSYYEETNLTVGENREYYLRGQDLIKQAGKESAATYFQALLKGETALENRYDLMKGEMISEGALSGEGYDLAALVAKKLPSLSGLESVEWQEDIRQDTVLFSMTQEAVNEIWQEFIALFPEAALEGKAEKTEANGVYTFSKEGEVVAFALSLKATFGGETFTYQVSMTPRSVSSPELPDALAIPEYIDPNHGGTDHN